MGNLIIKSSAFKDGERIPAKYTCDGDNVNPFLEIRNVPQGTKSLALIIDDPDATNGGVWDHWVIWNIEPGTQYIAEDTVPHGSIQGKSSWGSRRYGGPCPREGSAPHRYMFKLYALDTALELPEESGKTELLGAIEGHILDEAILMGKYGR
jgi:hypothetical protein